MDQLVEKLQEIEKEIAKEKGPLNLFALFEREDLYDRWDLVIAAPWAEMDRPTLRYVADVLRRHLLTEEMVRLARMVILDATEDPVRAITEYYAVEHGRIELTHPRRFGLPVKYGYIFTSRRAA